MTNERAQDPEQLRREIAATRADMDRTLEELEDRVRPSRIKDRQTAKVRSRLERVKGSVMGSAQDVRDRGTAAAGGVHDRIEGAQDAVHQAPQQLESAARGNPLAAGMIAFGIGALAGSLLPASSPERRMAAGLRDQFEEPLREALLESGQQVRTELQEHAQEVVEDTKESARQAAAHVRDDAGQAAGEVREHAQDATESVRSQH